METIDFHTHILSPRLLSKVKGRFGESNAGAAGLRRIKELRRQARSWARPMVDAVHGFQTLIRHFPDGAQAPLEGITELAGLPGLLIESTEGDLLEAMDQADVRTALVMPHPRFLSNDEVLELSKIHHRLLPVVSVGIEIDHPAKMLKKYVEKGAIAVKIDPHPARLQLDSRKYSSILKMASDLEIPIILHTGCGYNGMLSHQRSGQIQQFEAWFKNYPHLNFILIQLNFSNPDIVYYLCDQYSNLYIETSGQPAEAIGEIARRIGASRVLYGSNWPWIGDNLAITKKRVELCEPMGLLNREQIELILGGNAVKLLGLETNAPSV